ncbi:BspA family leucine-rich repeat surface protein [Vibrio atlanticus]|uniref:BspA family leucine-rich repeat surface protein n=1 Tax=Vibrio atlanticus TaxID=693153 RepID=UPI003552DEB2
MNKIKIALSTILLASGTAQASSFVSFVSHQNGSFIPEKVECSNPITREELVLMIENNEDYSLSCTREIENFSSLFRYKSVNYSIKNWDVSNGTDFSDMFFRSPNFNQDISNWDVSKSTTFAHMFERTQFNQDISNWDVSNSRFFNNMFGEARFFNQDISDWDVSNGIDFGFMFADADMFNSDIGDWDVSTGRNFAYMFQDTLVFNHDISDWDVSRARGSMGFYNGSVLSESNVPERFRPLRFR